MGKVTRVPPGTLPRVLTGRGGFIVFAPPSKTPAPSTSAPTPDEVPQPGTIDCSKESIEGHAATNPDLKGRLDQLRTEVETLFAELLDEAERDVAAERGSGVDQKVVQPPDGSPDKEK